MLRLPGAAPSAASCAEPPHGGRGHCALAMVAGEASGDLLAGLLLRRPARALARPAGASASAGRRWRRRASRPGGRTTSWRCAATSRCCATTARSSASATRWPSACCASGPTPSSASTRPTSTSAWRRGCKRGGHPTVHFVSPSIWAWRGGRVKQASRAAADHVLCLFPFEPELLRAAWHRGHLRRPSAGRRDPAGGAARREPRARSGLAERDTVVALLPGSRRSRDRSTSRRAFLQAAALLQRAAARPALRAAGGAGPARRWSSRCCAQHAPGRAAAAARRPLARGAGRLRRDADRQRHGHAGGGAVQAADGHRLPHALAELADA